MNQSRKAAPAASTSTQNLLQIAAAKGNYRTFARAIEAAGLSETLTGPGPFTVFAPTDAAFEALPVGTLDKLMQPENKSDLVSLLQYHCMTGRKTASELGRWDSARTMQGGLARMKVVGRQVSIDGAQVTAADIDARNGYLHGIDKVNLPPAGTP